MLTLQKKPIVKRKKLKAPVKKKTVQKGTYYHQRRIKS